MGIGFRKDGYNAVALKGPMIGTKTSILIARQPLLVRVRPVVYPFHVANQKSTNSLRTYNVAMTFVDKITQVIYDRGCLRSGEEWVERNLVPVAAVAVALAVLQILGICFAQNLRADIFAQMAKWG